MSDVAMRDVIPVLLGRIIFLGGVLTGVAYAEHHGDLKTGVVVGAAVVILLSVLDRVFRRSTFLQAALGRPTGRNSDAVKLKLVTDRAWACMIAALGSAFALMFILWGTIGHEPSPLVIVPACLVLLPAWWYILTWWAETSPSPSTLS